MNLRALPWPRIALGAVSIIAVAFTVTHVASLFTDRINWDEFLLFQRAEIAVKEGRVEGGGRPGLGVIALVPFVADCINPVDAINAGRVLWGVITFALLAGLFVLLRMAAKPSAHASHAAALGTAALALVPVFMRWSLQVRTDQPAIMLALWGGVALLASERRPRRALLAGALLGCGYLFSQKAIYVGGLSALLAVGRLFVHDELTLRREALRAGLVGAGIAIALAAYKLIVPLFYEPASAVSLERGMNTFAYYRSFLGYRVYRSMVPTLYPHILMAVMLVIALVVAARRGAAQERRTLVFSLAIAAAGLVVGLFHAAAFPYFWMTLGLFASAALAFAWPAIHSLLGRACVVVTAAAWLWLLAIAVPYAREILDETQAPQRESFAFIERNFAPTAFGFHADGGMFCRADPNPFPGYVRQSIVARFAAPGSDERVNQFIDAFRSKPVSFVITNGLDLFPARIQSFWASHYVRYYGAVSVAGFAVPASAPHEIDVIVPGAYRWLGGAPLHVAGATVPPNAALELAKGTHQVSQPGRTGGVLVLALADPPAPHRPAAFHSIVHIAEIVGNRLW